MNTPDTKILFVDDEPQVLETISLIFRNWHFVTAVGAEAALKAISAKAGGIRDSRKVCRLQRQKQCRKSVPMGLSSCG